MAKPKTKSAAPAAAKKAKGLGPVVAVAKINRKILPGTVFVPDSEQELADLTVLNAVREPTEAELALHEKMEANSAAAVAADGAADDAADGADDGAADDADGAADEANIG